MTRKYNPILIFLIVFIISILIRFYPLIQNYSTHSAGYSGPTTYNVMYILDNGRLLDGGAVQTFTSFGSTIYNHMEYSHLQILDAIISIVTGGSLSSWTNLIFTSIIVSIPFYLVILSFYHNLQNEKITTIDLLALSLFIFLGTPTIINGIAIVSNAFYSWFLICLSFLLYLKHDDIRRKTLLIFNLIILVMIYFTPSFVYLGFFVMLYFYNYIKKREDLSKTILILYLILFVSFSMYIGTLRFNSTISMLDSIGEALIQDGLDTFFKGSSVESNVIYPYLISTSIQNKITRAINAVLVSIPLFYFLLFGSNNLKDEKLNNLIWSYSLSLFPLGIMFSAWMGIWGLWRLAEWGGLISLITFSSIIGVVNKKSKVILISFVFLAILTSSYAYVTDENLPTNKVTYAEHSNLLWIKQHFEPSNEQVIFTDMRLGGSLISEGYFKTVGLQDIKDRPDRLINAYKDIYCNNDSFLAQTAISSFKLQDGENVKYLFFSEQMTKMVPGICVYSYTLKPPSDDFLSNYDNYSFTNSVYNNGVSKFYCLKTSATL